MSSSTHNRGGAPHLWRRCLGMAGRNLAQHRLRSATAVGGITFALFLLTLQFGFLAAVRSEASLLFDYFDFDLAILADDYQFLYAPPQFDRIRLTQAMAQPEVVDSFNLNIATGRWRDSESGLRSSLFLIGIDTGKPQFISDPSIAAGVPILKEGRQVLLDAWSHRDYGPMREGTKGEINDQEVVVGGLFQLGLFFYAEGAALVDNGRFSRLAHRSARMTTVGLLRLTPGTDSHAVAARLRDGLPRDVQVLTRSELIEREQNYFVTIKPMGIIFQSGMIIALVIGGVILFQVLSTELGNRLREFATLRAMGFGEGFVIGIGVAQALLLLLLSLLPALLLSAALFSKVRALTHLPLTLNGTLLSTVLAAALLMSLFAVLASLQRLRRADPAELY